MLIKEIIAVVIAYLLGSIPFAYIAVRMRKGVDIRKVGTGNAGAMNAWREAGTGSGVSVLFLDIAKGSLAIIFANLLGVPLLVVMLCGFAVIVGHNWPVFLQFRGGRGASTALGVTLAVMPVQFGISFIVIAGIFLLTRNTSLVIGMLLLMLAFTAWVTGRGPVYIVYPLALAVLGALRNLLDFKKEIAKPGGIRRAVFAQSPLPWQKKNGN